MNLPSLATAINGRFVRLGEHHGFLESSLAIPNDGTLLGAYLFDGEGDRVRVSDDGDTLFRVSVAGAELSASRIDRYRAIARENDVELLDTGELVCTFEASHATAVLPRYFETAFRIALASLKHRPKVSDKFTNTVGTILADAMPHRVSRRHAVRGASGHQLFFPFALDVSSTRPILLQPVAAKAGKVDWNAVYQTGGKFRDVLNSGAATRRIAVLEPAESDQIAKARLALGDSADVILFRSPETLTRALAA